MNPFQQRSWTWLVIYINNEALIKILPIAFLPSHLRLVPSGRAELTTDPNFQMIGYQAFGFNSMSSKNI